MKVAFFSSEVFPFAKTGGLADVSGALPLALEDAGIDVKIFMPLYKKIKPRKLNHDFGVSKVGRNVEVIFIKNDEYFLRDHLYNTPEGDYPDNLERFSYFCAKSFDVLKAIKFKPDILHCNDWQSSLIPVFLKAKFKRDNFFKDTKTVLTIHNLAFQGYFELDKFTLLDISEEYKPLFEVYNKLNLLKAGIIASDRVNTVSPSYAQEIQADDFGCGLAHVLRDNRAKLSGILNAIDYNVWSPSGDKLIYSQYDEDSLDKKADGKMSFQKDLGLKQDADRLLLGMVSRLTEQKGVDILSEALPAILKKHQVVILGLGDPKYHEILQGLAGKNPRSFSFNVKFDESLAHKIYASSDVFLLPSRFEPCGLSQMISFKYATLPLVHATGGLRDTVIDCSRDKKQGNGFVFTEYSSKALAEAVKRADSLYRNKGKWRLIQERVSALNFSWQKAAQEYLNLYKVASRE